MGVENDLFWSKQGQDLEDQAAHPHQEPRIPRSTPSPRILLHHLLTGKFTPTSSLGYHEFLSFSVVNIMRKWQKQNVRNVFPNYNFCNFKVKQIV